MKTLIKIIYLRNIFLEILVIILINMATLEKERRKKEEENI